MLVPVKACLNWAIRENYLLDARCLSGFSLASYSRMSEDDPLQSTSHRRYLTPAERRRIIKSADSDESSWVRLCCNTPLRPGDWHDRRVKHFDPKAGTLFVQSKTNPRHVKLSSEMVALLKECSKSKLPNALLYTVNNDGTTMWDKYAWNDSIKRLAKEAEIQGVVCLYDLRHSTINELLEAGLSATQTAIIAGTSIKMIDENYKKAIEARQVSALESIAI